MSGIPVDMLVDIDGSYERFPSSQYYHSSDNAQQQDDDPFELCSMQGKHTKKDLGLELGLALEKSIKLRSQHQDSTSAGTPVNSCHTDLGILINFDDSPDKKTLNAPQNVKSCEHVKDSVFTHTASNPFELAWDVIEQEALNLAEHIQHDKEKTISPRKMVDLAMRLSPDSLLLSPRNDSRDEEILINSSPELDMKKTPRLTKTQQSRGRMSIGSSPVVTKSYATPLRSRPSLAANPSPLRRPNKLPMPSPAKPLPPKSTFKTPLLRSSSATAPSNGSLPAKPIIKAGPMKVVHPQHSSSVPPKVPNKPMVDTPIRRSLAPSGVTSAPPPILSFQSKLKAPLNRADSDTPQNGPPLQRQGSLRYGSKRASISHPPSTTSNSSTNNSQTNRFVGLPRAKAKGRENIEP